LLFCLFNAPHLNTGQCQSLSFCCCWELSVVLLANFVLIHWEGVDRSGFCIGKLYARCSSSQMYVHRLCSVCFMGPSPSRPSPEGQNLPQYVHIGSGDHFSTLLPSCFYHCAVVSCHLLALVNGQIIFYLVKRMIEPRVRSQGKLPYIFATDQASVFLYVIYLHCMPSCPRVMFVLKINKVGCCVNWHVTLSTNVPQTTWKI